MKNGIVAGRGSRRERTGLLPRLATAAPVLLSVSMLATFGCVNRGQRAPDGGGSGGMGAGGQDAGHDLTEPRDMAGGPDTASTACVLTDAGADGGAAADAADAADAATCSPFMSFENCVIYAPELLPPTSQLAFTNFSAISAPTQCGSGALAIDANLVASDADTIHYGELRLTIPGGPIDLTGKTLTVHVSATVTSSPLTILYIIPMNSNFTYGSYVRVSPLRTTWTTASMSYKPGDDASDSVRFSIQLRGPVDYAGKIYIDEIEIANTPPPDGGTGDAGDVRPGDARDGNPADGSGDTRDGPSGN